MAGSPITSGVYASVATPGGVVNPAQILILQAPYNAPDNPLTQNVTNGINNPPLMDQRFRHFSENIYRLNPSDHIVRFTKVLLGQAGVGQYRSRALSARLQSQINGANFYELDSFYGAVFGFNRTSSEQLSLSPYIQLGTYDQWASVKVQDSSYLTRIDQFAKAITLGATVPGMQAVAQAVLQIPVTITESTASGQGGYTNYNTYGHLEQYGAGSTIIVGGATWGNLDGHTFATLESTSVTGNASNPRTFIISPSAPITDEQELALRIAIDTLKPADAAYTVVANAYSEDVPVSLRGVYADSSYWHLVESIIPVPAYSSIYQLSPNANFAGFREILRPVGSEYQGELIVYNNDILSVVSGINPDSSGSLTAAPEADFVVFWDGTNKSYPATDGIASRLSYITARLVSDGILQSNEFSGDVNHVDLDELQQTTGYVNNLSLIHI